MFGNSDVLCIAVLLHLCSDVCKEMTNQEIPVINQHKGILYAHSIYGKMYCLKSGMASSKYYQMKGFVFEEIFDCLCAVKI